MNFSDRLEWLYQLRGKNIKLGLEPTLKFLDYLNLKDLPFQVIHIAGTNGKGSVAFFLYKLLIKHGIKTALYTSPHIAKFNERIRVNDQYIPDGYIENFLKQHETYITSCDITFFEATTAMAFSYMADQHIDVAVVETGLGGRFDATNVVDPIAIGLTQIALDHKEFLGDNLTLIAREKLGIVKHGRPFFATPQDDSLYPQFEKAAEENNSSLKWSVAEEIELATDGTIFNWQEHRIKLSMLGVHQAHNAALALDISAYLLRDRFSIVLATKVLSTINWPGRIELVADNPSIILDVAHNHAGMKTLFSTLEKTFPGLHWIGVMGIMADKDLTDILPTMRQMMRKVHCLTFDYYRALPAEDLHGILLAHNIEAQISQLADLKKIIKGLRSDEGLVIFGTHYILAETREKINSINNKVKRLTKA